MATDALQQLINQINMANSVQSQDFDPGLETAIQQIMLKAADLESQKQRGEARLGSEYQSQEYMINRALDEALGTLMENKADQGMLRSGIYVQDQADTSQYHQDMLAEAARRRTQALADLEMEYKSGRTGLQSGLLGEKQSSADRLAQARHQAALEAQEASYRERMLDYQRQQSEAEKGYYSQQSGLMQQMAGSQQDYYNRLMASMQPGYTPTGQVVPPPPAGSLGDNWSKNWQDRAGYGGLTGRL